MDPELETALQVAGVLAGAAGAYLAWRQLHLLKTAAPARSSTGEVFMAKEAFDVADLVLGGLFLVVGAYFLFKPRESPWFDYGGALVFLALAVLSFQRSDREHRVEVDGEALTVHLRSVEPTRIPWERITEVYIGNPDGIDRLMIRTHEHTGVIEGLHRRGRAYQVCGLRDVRPSMHALRAALDTYSGGRLRD